MMVILTVAGTVGLSMVGYVGLVWLATWILT